MSIFDTVPGPGGKPLSARRLRALIRLTGPRSAMFRRRVAIVGGAISIGLVAILFAGLCGLVVAVIGCATQLTWGTGYEAARGMMSGTNAPIWFGFAKFTTTLATAWAGMPGGIFAPSLATGAGFGNMLRWLFPGEPAGAVVLLGMVAYFAGVVRAPLTAVFILTETTASRGLLLPMMAAALVANQMSQLVCREKLYNGLARGFATSAQRADGGRIEAVEQGSA